VRNYRRGVVLSYIIPTHTPSHSHTRRHKRVSSGATVAVELRRQNARNDGAPTKRAGDTNARWRLLESQGDTGAERDATVIDS